MGKKEDELLKNRPEGVDHSDPSPSTSGPNLIPTMPPRQELPFKVREEGELSQSDDDENPRSSAPPASASINLPASEGQDSVPPANQLNKGKGASNTNSVAIQSRLSGKPKNHKSFLKNRVPFKSANTGQFAPLASNNNNLVISFSDDESDSEPENHRGENDLEAKQKKAVSNGNQRVRSHQIVNSFTKQPSTSSLIKAMPKRSSVTRTFSASFVKNSGKNTRVSGFLSAENVAQARNLNNVSRNFSTHEQSFEQAGAVSRHKLQDLRQQIALRERELKLKATQLNKECASVPVKAINLSTLSSDASRRVHAAAGNDGMLANEPERKRRKVGRNDCQPFSDCVSEELAGNSISQSKMQLPENIIYQDNSMAANNKKGGLIGSTEPYIAKPKKQKDESANGLTENPSTKFTDGDRIDLRTSMGHSGRSQVQEPRCMSQDQTLHKEIAASSCYAEKDMDGACLNHPIAVGGQQAPNSFLETVAREQNVVDNCVNPVGGGIDKVLWPISSGTGQPSQDKVRLSNDLQIANASESRNLNMEAFAAMEESLDQELEEAQDFRHKCEIEERNALKAYRKAQRALIQANARCRELYRKREHYSSHFGSALINDSNLQWPSGHHLEADTGMDSANIASRSLDLPLTFSHQLHPEFDMGNRSEDDANITCARDVPLNTSSLPMTEQHLGSEPCSEHDASTSEPLRVNRNNAPDRVRSLSYDSDSLADEDDSSFPIDRENEELNFRNQQRNEIYLGTQEMNHPSQGNCSIDDSLDPLILEAQLRSELFARLRMRTSSRDPDMSNDEAGDVQIEKEDTSDRTKTIGGAIPFSEVGKDQEYNGGGNHRPESNNSGALLEIQEHKKSSPNCHTFDASEDIIDSMHENQLGVFSPVFEWRTAFAHLSIMKLASLESQCTEPRKGVREYDDDEDGCIDFEEVLGTNMVSKSVEESFDDVFGGEIGYLVCPNAVDLFWPLCMFDLRGKCNNGKCPWQHVKDLLDGKVSRQHEDFSGADCQVGPSLHPQNPNGVTKLSKSPGNQSPPTYIVGLDTLKAVQHSFESVFARRDGQSWQKSFSICLAVSNLLHRDFPIDQPLLHGIDGRIEAYGSWNRQLPYFHSRNISLNNLNQASAGNTQTLEMALLILSQEVNKLEGIKKALSVLSRAIEADQTSEVLWITYLLIFHYAVRVEKDDMFSCAVKHVNGSYGLWLMYINSRMHFDERLIAYDVALKALCHQFRGSASACILDLLLQKLGCLCMSGNVEKAIKAVSSLLPVAAHSDEPCSQFLSDILACLTISDKLLFWVCCVYLVIYRKLPDAVVRQFEFEKQLLAIDWPSIQLSADEKESAVKLIEEVVDSARLYVMGESIENEINLKAAHHFALSHIRCMAAIGCWDCCWSLLDDYLKLYPLCLELILVSARMQINDDTGLCFQGFEEALCDWPKEVPGINCIWNQYFECSLSKDGLHHTRELTVRWFNSVLSASSTDIEKMEMVEANSSQQCLESASVSNPVFLLPHSNSMDIVFGYLNFALAKLLLGDDKEARLSIDRALKAAGQLYIKTCIKELATFLLVLDSNVKDVLVYERLDILKSYLGDVWAVLIPEALSRRFIKDVEKPRVRDLVSDLLCPVSPDFSVVNMVLEVWYGPSLIPPNLIQPKDLVNYVEAVLEMVPSNYLLALSVCKLLRNGYISNQGNPSSILYWASSVLFDSLCRAIPVAVENVWVEATDMLGDFVDTNSVSDRFYERALSIYPFSLKLWTCFYHFCKSRGDAESAVVAAREKGILLG